MRDAAWDAFVTRVRDASDILRVVSSYVPLKRKGSRYWACCPFHNEKTPSFSVTPDKGGLFYCFGCHAGGDIFKFISLIENVTYGEAIKLQAEKLGIPLPDERRSSAELARDQKVADMRKVMGMARDFFHSCLVNTPYGKPGLEYFAGRGIGKDIIDDFSLGFAPDSFDKLKNAFLKRGVPEKLLLECGLVKQRKSGAGTYDTFRGRVMIPIADERGRFVGFGGRVMDDSVPKYLNSPETMIFNKRKLLFGLDRAKKAIRDEGYVILVEGYMYAISVASAGVRNVVASLGTSFTIEHARLIMRYAPEIYFCYDSDEAGQKATIRALSIIRATGAKVKVLIVPDGKDPDEFIRKHGVDAFRGLAKKALPVADYQIKYALAHNDIRTMDGKSNALRAIVPVLAAAQTVERMELVQELKRTLAIDEGIITQEISRYKGEPAENIQQSAPMRQAVRRIDDAVMRAGRVVVRQAWEDTGTLADIEARVPLDDFPVALHGEILKYLAKCELDGVPISESGAFEALSEDAASELSRILSETFAGGTAADLYDECAQKIYISYLKIRLEGHRIKADELQRAGEDFIGELEESNKIQKKINELERNEQQ